MENLQRRGGKHEVENKLALFSSCNCDNEKSCMLPHCTLTKTTQPAEWMFIFDDRWVRRGEFGISVVKKVLLCKYFMKKLLPFPKDGAVTFRYTTQSRHTSFQSALLQMPRVNALCLGQQHHGKPLIVKLWRWLYSPTALVSWSSQWNNWSEDEIGLVSRTRR